MQLHASPVVVMTSTATQALPQAALLVGAAARVLDATNNQLRQVPEGIDQLTSLHRLILAANQLQSLPSAVCQLSSLKVKAELGAEHQLCTMAAYLVRLNYMLLPFS